MQVYTLNEIKKVEEYIPQLIDMLSAGYVKYSAGETNVPPVGLLHFDDPEGNTYIKYGHVHGDESFVIKVFNGFPENAKLGLPTSDGMNLVFDAKTGMTKAILLDEGWLTRIRTAAAAILTARHLAPKDVKKVGICGTGTIATAVASMLKYYTDCKEIVVYDVWEEGVKRFVDTFTALGYNVTTGTPADICNECNLIFSATTTHTPHFYADMVKPGTHITGIGADADGKNEVDASVFAKADICVCDSRSQCFVDGDTSFAVKSGAISEDKVLELGEVISQNKGRTSDDQITVCDLTGIAVQDIIVAELTCDVLTGKVQ